MCSVGVTDYRDATIVCVRVYIYSVIHDNSDLRLTAHIPTGLVGSIMLSYVLRDSVNYEIH